MASEWWQYGIPAVAGIGVISIVGIGMYTFGQWIGSFTTGAEEFVEDIPKPMPVAGKFLSEEEFEKKLREYVRVSLLK